jgi:hypothetical protein
MSRLRLALLFLCALLTVELTLHNHSLIPGDGSSAALAAQQATCPACATTSGNLAPVAPRAAAPLPVVYALPVNAAPVPVHSEPLSLPSRAPPQA